MRTISGMGRREGTRKRGRRASLWVLCLILGAGGLCFSQESLPQEELGPSSGSLQVGHVAPSWGQHGWVNSEPLDVDKLRGKVILLRFLHDSPSGAATLKEFYRAYRAQGLEVVGFYTPDPMPAATDLEHVRRLVASQGFSFPVGLDSRWETLNRYWLEQPDAEMTSTTFLIDRQGVIRYIQPNGQYEKSSTNRAARRGYETMQRVIEGLLKETVPAE